MDPGDLLSLVLGGFVVGGLARLAVPGPDPMPVWLTLAIGLVSVFVGGGAGFALAAEFGALVGAVLCATLVVIVYRRFVQKRGITGPGAQRFPTRGIGVARMRRRLGFDGATAGGAAGDVAANLRKLADLRDAGVLTQAEFEAKERELLRRS